MPGLPNCPRFTYGVDDAEELELTLPTRMWDVSTSTVGGRMVSAAGVPAAFVVRTDHLLSLPLRVTEGAEWQEVVLLAAWGQLGEPFTWYPDAEVPETSYEVYLESPAAGEGLTPVRADGFPEVLELTLLLRRVDGQTWDLPFFVDEE